MQRSGCSDAAALQRQSSGNAATMQPRMLQWSMIYKRLMSEFDAFNSFL